MTDVKETSATLHVQVDPEGFPTSYRFEYTTEAAFATSGFTGSTRIPATGETGVGSGSNPILLSPHLTGLQRATVYRYRVVATNSAGPPTVGSARWLTTDEQAPLFTLPDGRQWELVSPVDKNGGAIQGFGANFGGDVLQAAAAGGAVTYSSRSSFANAQGAPAVSQYMARRSSTAWDTDNVTLPTASGAFGDRPDGVPYQLFSPDLASALMLDGRCREAEPCPRSYSLRNNGTAAVSPLPYVAADLNFVGATPDLAHIALSTCVALLPAATELPANECDPAKANLSANLYERTGSTLRLINFLPGDTAGTPGATLAAQSGAISSDGSRVYWTNGTNLYLRGASTTIQVDEDAGGGGTFETASTNGLVAYFSKGEHLWRYLTASEAATDLTPGGGVKGVLGASDDGSSVYYLTTAGLFLWRSSTGTSIPVAPQPEVTIAQAVVDSYPPTTGTARVSADGSHLAFVSAAELTSFDNRKEGTSSPEPEVYLYTAPSGTAAATLVCASCNPTGERPIATVGFPRASLPGASPNGAIPADPSAPAPTRAYKPRVLAADGTRLFFTTFDALAVQDTNNDQDVYEWRAQGLGGCGRIDGCINLISSGRSEGGASFVDASADGSDVFFLTDGSLIEPLDPGSVDLYDARIGGGLPQPADEQECIGDACQPLPPEPEDPTPGTLRPGRPNPPLPVQTPRCKKGQVKKHGKCVKKKKPRHHKRGGRK